MVKVFSSKLDKHFHDDEKRRESLRKKVKEKFNQKLLIKSALSDQNALRTCKKIIFDTEEIQNNETKAEDKLGDSNHSENIERQGGTKKLFDESDNEEDEKYEVKVRSCFEGKKGHKLFYLQSNYNNDERFRLDERFQDDIDEDGEENDGNVGENPDEVKHVNAEKVKQIELLEDVLGYSVNNRQKNEGRSKKSFFEMVRFDATNESHKRQKTDDGNANDDTLTRKKTGRERRVKVGKKQSNALETSKPITSDKKFYKVSNDLKAALKNRNKETSSFSLLATFSKSDLDSRGDAYDSVEEKDSEKNEPEVVGEKKQSSNSDMKNSSNQNNDEEGNVSTKVHGIVNEKFFFDNNDSRFEEGLNFINMKDSDELKQVMENYDKRRRDLREVLRLRLQKFRQKKNPFKRKIGGSKAQILNFNKSRRFKKFPGKRK